jgi:hypothetical protein
MMGRFQRLINDPVLKELHLHGRKYTWSNQQESPTPVPLDRVLYSIDWEDIFPNCLLQSTASDDSDHCPLLLGLHDNLRGRRRFHFESFWPKLEGFHEAVLPLPGILSLLVHVLSSRLRKSSVQSPRACKPGAAERSVNYLCSSL